MESEIMKFTVNGKSINTLIAEAGEREEILLATFDLK
jgi:hypothetical protein